MVPAAVDRLMLALTPEQLATIRVGLAEIAEVVGRYDEGEELCDVAADPAI